MGTVSSESLTNVYKTFSYTVNDPYEDLQKQSLMPHPSFKESFIITYRFAN